ncbi:hypothetical protein [Profundibacter sp.]
MMILMYMSLACYGAAAILLIAMFNAGFALYLVPAMSALIAGVLFAALDKIIDTLVEIRDAVASEPDVAQSVPNIPASLSLDTPDLVELAEKIERLRAENGNK